jgi:hypothetical protein
MPTKKVFDCFIFYNELDLLKIRLEELYDHVDYFVICEATVTFQGKPKPAHFDLNKSAFARFADKIIHLIVDDMPAAGLEPDYDAIVWGREHHQRNAIRRGLGKAQPDDIVIISDCDEIIRPDAIKYLRGNSGYFLLDMPMYQFFLNMCAQESGWRKPFAYSYDLDAEIPDFNVNRSNEMRCFDHFSGRNHYIRNAGWHFTFLGGAARVKDKLMAYSHTDGWHRRMWDASLLDDQMVALREVGGSKVLKYCRIDNGFPEVVQRDEKKYLDLGYIKDEFTRLKELEGLWATADHRHGQLSEILSEATRNNRELRCEMLRLGVEFAPLINLLPASHDFSTGWNIGVQAMGCWTDTTVEAPFPGNLVKQHQRDPGTRTPDNNVGYYSRVPIQEGGIYTASCWVWLPEDFSGQSVLLSVGDWPGQRTAGATLEILGQWQRIHSTATAPLGTLGANAILRVSSHGGTKLASSCWQFEEGGSPKDYAAT